MPLVPTIDCNKIDCGESLLSNYSSEGAEPYPPFYAVVFPPPNPPPIDTPWSMAGCLYVCVSYISQEDADLCALRQSILCTTEDIWYSAPASCTVTCPDGTEFTFNVPAGSFIAKTYAEALAQAQAYACEQANEQRICLGSLPRCTCVGSHYAASLTLVSPRNDLIWTLFGFLPPGLQFISGGGSAVITGVPSVNGTYSFQVIATDPNGNYAIKTFVIQVLEVTTASLPDFTIGVAYSQQLTAAGGSGNYSWRVATGTLPDGLSLSQAGLISGTPTAIATGGTLTFEVVDLTCETAQRIEETPRAVLQTHSSTRVTAYRGFVEYGNNELAQLYKRVDYAGSLTQIAFPNFNADESVNQTQCAGCQFIYSGYDQIDIHGNILNRHRKDMMLMCAASQPKLFEIEISGSTQALITPILHPPALFGYCWPDDQESCSVCNTNETTWNLYRNDAWFGANDYPTDIVWDIKKLVVTPLVISYASSESLQGGVILDPTIQGFPKNNGQGIYTQAYPFVRISSSGGFSATLSEPYTDADANATAVVYTGTLATAENVPNYQITGANNMITRRNRVTTVDFTILCTRLVIGEDYTVTYELVSNTGAGSSHVVDFTADDVTHEITGTIPAPTANVKTTIKNVRIQFT